MEGLEEFAAEDEELRWYFGLRAEPVGASSNYAAMVASLAWGGEGTSL